MTDELIARAALVGSCPLQEPGEAAEAAAPVQSLHPHLPPFLQSALLQFGPTSAPVRALAAEVAAAQQGLAAAQLLAHVAASGMSVSNVQVQVTGEASGVQRVTLFLDNGGPPVWATAPGLQSNGLMALPGLPLPMPEGDAATHALRKQARAKAALLRTAGGSSSGDEAADDDEEDDYEDPPEPPPAAAPSPGQCPPRN